MSQTQFAPPVRTPLRHLEVKSRCVRCLQGTRFFGAVLSQATAWFLWLLGEREVTHFFSASSDRGRERKLCLLH